MGTFKKEAARRTRDGTSKGGEGVKVKGVNFYRTAKQAKQLKIEKSGKAQRDADGNITQAAAYQSRDIPQARIEPNRKWFSNSRVISQDSLTAFREAMSEKEKDPYTVLLKSNKLPMSLIRDGQEKNTINGIKQHQAKMTVETSPFAEVFGPKSSRKRVKLSVSTIDDLANDTVKSLDTYHERREEARLLSGEIGAAAAEAAGDLQQQQPDEAVVATAIDPIFYKGQSKRIWNELYKVIDSSDVILHVLDARDPLGTRCRSVEKYLREEAPHKHLVFILNKTDLVPTSIAAQWVKILQKDAPTCAFRASIQNPFGKGSLINLLRQFSKLHSDRKQVSVGLIGYPNSGKSSIINTLRAKKVATVAPIPGETKVWQYVTLMKRIFLIDCPGIVPQNHNDQPTQLLLRGVVRVENVENPEMYIPALLKIVKKHHMARTYQLSDWNDDHIQFLEQLARKGGRILKGGDPDLDGVAKMVILDFIRGKIPWFMVPPPMEGKDDGTVSEGREGKLGEMRKKRKRDEADTESKANEAADNEEVDMDETFNGFGSDSEPDISSDEESEAPDDKAKEEEEEQMIPLEASDDDDADAEKEDAGGGGAALEQVEPETKPDPPKVGISNVNRRPPFTRRKKTS